MEATKLLKPLVQRVARRLGERAGRNVSKRCAGLEKTNAGADPPRFRGRPKLVERYERTSSFHQTCRGIGDGMQAKGTIRNTGSPSGDRGVDQLAARERRAGLTGMAERLAVPMKPAGNSGGGKGTWFRQISPFIWIARSISVWMCTRKRSPSRFEIPPASW